MTIARACTHTHTHIHTHTHTHKSTAHMYHHCSMILNWWLGVKYVVGGQCKLQQHTHTHTHTLTHTHSLTHMHARACARAHARTHTRTHTHAHTHTHTHTHTHKSMTSVPPQFHDRQLVAGGQHQVQQVKTRQG